jgi:hypothetical protein
MDAVTVPDTAVELPAQATKISAAPAIRYALAVLSRERRRICTPSRHECTRHNSSIATIADRCGGTSTIQGQTEVCAGADCELTYKGSNCYIPDGLGQWRFVHV